MGDFDNPEEVINAKEAFAPPPPKKQEPKVDIPLSKIVGRKVVMGTPTHRRAVHIIAKWNRSRNPDDLSPSKFFDDPKKVKELKDALR